MGPGEVFRDAEFRVRFSLHPHQRSQSYVQAGQRPWDPLLSRGVRVYDPLQTLLQLSQLQSRGKRAVELAVWDTFLTRRDHASCRI